MSINTGLKELIYRRTKIVATIGPASWDKESIHSLILAGASVFRLNMSHGDHDSHSKSYHRIRAVAEALGSPVAILADLCGPKIRVGKFPNGPLLLNKGEEVVVTTRDVSGGDALIPCQYPLLHEEIAPGNRIMIADGVIELRALDVSKQDIRCAVIHGGEVSDHKGVNLPDTRLSVPALTEKDREDARFSLNLGVDLLALSFVRSEQDVIGLQNFAESEGFGSTFIIAKIERPEALDNIDEILEASYGIMVARGDLGVELPAEQVPMIQKQLIDLARSANKPVIIATQMLESMIMHTRPTRAEVADVSHAVTSGVDAVMLSAETASGAYPKLAVSMMDRIAHQAESYQWHAGVHGSFDLTRKNAMPPLSHADAVARATSSLSHDLMVHAIVVISATGASTLAVSSARPSSPIIAITSNQWTYRRMSLLWGVIPVLVDEINQSELYALARQQIKKLGMADEGDNILLVRGFHSEMVKNSPSITILSV